MNITANTFAPTAAHAPAWVDHAQAVACSLAAHPMASPLRAAVDFFAPHRAKPITPFVARNLGACAHSTSEAPQPQPDAASSARTVARVAAQSHGVGVASSPLAHAHASASRSAVVRVLRVVEPKLPAGSAGRMRISGRIDEVCAELDRLVGLQARSN
jgi:hypothetical protein